MRQVPDGSPESSEPLSDRLEPLFQFDSPTETGPGPIVRNPSRAPIRRLPIHDLLVGEAFYPDRGFQGVQAGTADTNCTILLSRIPIREILRPFEPSMQGSASASRGFVKFEAWVSKSYRQAKRSEGRATQVPQQPFVEPSQGGVVNSSGFFFLPLLQPFGCLDPRCGRPIYSSDAC